MRHPTRDWRRTGLWPAGQPHSVGSTMEHELNSHGRRSRPFPRSAKGQTLLFLRQLEARRVPLAVTGSVVGLNVVVFLAAGAGFGERSAQRVLELGGGRGTEIAEGAWWRLLTAGFLHLRFDHLLGNVLFLYVAGRITEPLYGHGRFAALYLASIAGCSGAHVLVHPHVAALGASGGVFGLFGAIIAYVLLRRRIVPSGAGRTLVVGFGCFVVSAVAWGLIQPGVSNVGHVGGFVSGFVVGLLCTLSLGDTREAVPLDRR